MAAQMPGFFPLSSLSVSVTGSEDVCGDDGSVAVELPGFFAFGSE
jgi:hypothetical protein